MAAHSVFQERDPGMLDTVLFTERPSSLFVGEARLRSEAMDKSLSEIAW